MSQIPQDVSVDEIIIFLVKERSYLYDKSSYSYKNNDKKNNAWEEIAQQVFEITGTPITAEKAKNKWEYFKTKYSEQRKDIAVYIPSGSAATKNPNIKWKYYNCMLFLEKHVTHRQTDSSYKLTDDEWKGEEKNDINGTIKESLIFDDKEENQNIEEKRLNCQTIDYLSAFKETWVRIPQSQRKKCFFKLIEIIENKQKK
ncbi:uncharacterized protein LOC127284275 [Leptopilina boulardi]|uniref:uncharacterized protein LOC127284275 n=1 Tax=Leptopilina boulardi TaxID=63433 RepID=UPI0021F53717|nr:uncharacterized protein LOC127284275 [Leptopilina boulardi]